LHPTDHQPTGAGHEAYRHRLPALDELAHADRRQGLGLDQESGEGLRGDDPLLGAEDDVDHGVVGERVQGQEDLGGVTAALPAVGKDGDGAGEAAIAGVAPLSGPGGRSRINHGAEAP